MSKARKPIRLDILPKLVSFTALVALFATCHAFGQRTGAASVPPTLAESHDSADMPVAVPDLPDAPSASLDVSSSSTGVSSSAEAAPVSPADGIPRIFGGGDDVERAKHPASTTDKYILPGQLAPKLTTGDKIEFGFIHGISAYGVLGWFVSAGYSHAINTTPNYGTDSGAFGERLGASALRGYATEVLKDSVTAPLFHQDPRYYKMGPRRNVAVRTTYAVTRIFITRGDDGRLAPNYSLVSGHLLGAALTNAYYPDVNRGFGQTAKTFGSSMYGAAFGFFAAEFLNGALEAIHLNGSHN